MSTRVALIVARVSSAASTSSTSDAAACTPISVARIRLGRPDPARGPSPLSGVSRSPPRAVPRRRQPGADAGRDRDQREEEIHAHVGRHVHRDREADDGRKRRAEPERQQQRDGSRGEAEREAFGHELADDAPARGAERQADADLAPARDRARQLQVRHVHAREQHDEADDGQDDGHDEREHAPRLGPAEARSRGIQPHAGQSDRCPASGVAAAAATAPSSASACARVAPGGMRPYTLTSTGDVRVSGDPL